MIMAKAVEELANKTQGKKALALEAFARALRTIPTYISDNGGYDSSELISELKAAHYKGNSTAGLGILLISRKRRKSTDHFFFPPSHQDMNNGTVTDVSKLGIVESFKVKSSILMNAAEAAEMILRVDEIIRAAPRFC